MLPPEAFRTVKQPPGSKICTLCVAAMATGYDIGLAAKLMNHRTLSDGSGFYTTAELLKYLGSCGIHCGMTFDASAQASAFKLTLDMPIENHPCVMVVKSNKFKNAQHLVFWDGRVVRDPNPGVPDECSIKDYFVIEIWPLVYIDDTKELTVEELMEINE